MAQKTYSNPIVQDKDLPPRFTQRYEGNYRWNNPFSIHDNRNDIQSTGEYFGNGRSERQLGRKIINAHLNLHNTDHSFLWHNTDGSSDPCSKDLYRQTNYTLSHTGAQSAPASHKRFSQHHKVPEPGPKAVTTTTIKDFTTSESSYKTPNQTLVSSLEPYVKHNAWKYAYHNHGNPTIYPKVWGDRCSIHLPTFKPSRRTVAARIKRKCT